MLSDFLNLSNDMTLEDLVKQLQGTSNKLLYVVNGEILKYYEKDKVPPLDVKLDRIKTGKNSLSEYYFRDEKNIYCVFGRECAELFYPKLIEFDKRSKESKSSEESKNPKKSREFSEKIMIIDKGDCFKFTYYDYPIEIQKH